MKTAILAIAVCVELFAVSSAQARNSVHKFSPHSKKNIAAVYLAKGKTRGYAYGHARGERDETREDVEAKAQTECKKALRRARLFRNIDGGRCRRLASGGAKCFALYVRPYPHKFRYALAQGNTQKRAASVARGKCGKNCRREIVSCAVEDAERL